MVAIVAVIGLTMAIVTPKDKSIQRTKTPECLQVQPEEHPNSG
jgi:hypothetical protein